MQISGSYINKSPIIKASKQNPVLFTGNKNNEENNPVSKTGEYFNAVYKSCKDSVKAGARVFFTIAVFNMDDDNFFSHMAVYGLIGLVAGVGVLCFSLPGNLYQAHIDFFTKKREMDKFIKESNLQQDMYKKLDERAKVSQGDEFGKTIDSYSKLALVKDILPDFAKNTNLT